MSSLDQLGNVIGMLGGQALNALNIGANLEHGNLQGYLANRAALSQDPGYRDLASRSAFMSGLGGFGYNPQVDLGNIKSGYGNEGQLINPTNAALPPLTPQAQADQAKAIREAQLQNLTPDQAAAMAAQARVGQPGGPSRLTIPTLYGAETFGGQTSGGGIGMNWPTVVGPGGNTYAVDPATGRGHPIKSAAAAPDPNDPVNRYVNSLFGGADTQTAPDASTTVPVPSVPTGATKLPLSPDAMARVKSGFDQMVAAGNMTPEERDRSLADIAQNPPSATDMQGGPVQAPPAQAPQLPAGHVAVGDIKAPTWADYATAQSAAPQVGYPSPAFTEGAAPPTQPAPAAAPAPRAPGPMAAPAPQGPQLPPGMTVSKNLKTGETKVSIKAPTSPRVPATSVSQMAVMAKAADAARQAIEMLDAGSQHDLTLFGRSTGLRPGLAGPVQGTALKYLGKVSDQPIAIEEANLRAAIDHAKSGITGIFGQRLTKENREFVDALLPDAAQPTGILRAHLVRLANFYQQQVELREVLANLTPKQREAFLVNQYHQTMMDIPTTSTTVPDVLDLR